MKNNYLPEALKLTGIDPFPYQWEGVKALASKRRYLIRDEPGLGKTIQCIVAANVIGHEKDLKILVLTTVSMVQTWKREVMKWATCGNYTVINHDKFASKDRDQYIRKWDLVICDEAHLYLRNRDTIRAKTFLEILLGDPIVWMATATPANKSAEDYYLMLKILLPKMYWKMNKTDFVKEYCCVEQDEFFSKAPKRGMKCIKAGSVYRCFIQKFTGFKNVEKLNKVLGSCSIKRTEGEVNLQLPELTFTSQYLDVPFSTLSVEEAEEIKRAVFEGRELGDGYHDKMREAALSKVASVLDILSTYPTDKKVVIFAWHRDVVETLTEKISESGRACDYIHGGTSEANRVKIMDAFQTGELNTLVINMKSGGVGITLTAATCGIYVQFPYSADQWQQSMKRIHRIGSKKPVQIIKLIAAGSIDEDIWEILSERLEKIKEIEG